ncbi:uncharacterized protein LOC127878558 [Dreissena polymorpha]|uniref:Receptor ligand binding region domain-containing protein n=1 Tax=Dreissena polymorpha TaxID=45954 RepID=A0A9D4MNL8_DREPO|nr:uncharacterized protein LOC127878558 [Dreissena polymorpha]KAH3880595.1 hypothetical protein DPMN_004514 [Dreissena polymorpha]
MINTCGYVICVCCLFIVNILQCQGDTCPSDISFTVNPDADVKFTVVTSLRHADGDKCGKGIDQSAWQKLVVMQWLVDKMNDANFTGNVKIGFDVHDDCGLNRKSMSRALDVLDGPVLGTTSCKANDKCQIGLISASGSSPTEALLYALDGSHIPVLSPIATRTNLKRYWNFFRTIPSDDHLLQALVNALKDINVTYVAVIYEDTDFGRYGVQMIRELGHAKGVCVDSDLKLTPNVKVDLTNLTAQRDRTKDDSLRVIFIGQQSSFINMKRDLDTYNLGETIPGITWLFIEQAEDWTSTNDFKNAYNGTLVMSHARENISEAFEYVKMKWNRVNNKSDDPIERLLASCAGGSNLTAVDADFGPTVDAVFVLLFTFQRQLKEKCTAKAPFINCSRIREEFNFKGEILNYPMRYIDMKTITQGALDIKEFTDKNRVVNFTADGNVLSSSHVPLYDVSVTVSGKQDVIGKITIDGFNLTRVGVVLPYSRCGESCPACVSLPDIPFAFIEGDTYILGIISIHETDKDLPFGCGQFRTQQMDVVLVEAFLHTVEAVRNTTVNDGRKNFRVGAIMLDDCYSYARMQLLLTKIMSGETRLKHPVTGKPIDLRNKIVAVVTIVSSTVTKAIADLMAEFYVPVISASASSKDLDDRANFPYFLRTIPSDGEQAKAMAHIVKKNDWKYISLMYVKNNYGSKGRDAFMNEAKNNGLCIANEPEGITDVDANDIDLKEVSTRILNHKTDITVYFGTEMRMKQFLRIINDNTPYIFLGSEDWGDRQHLLSDTGNKTLGSITMKNDNASIDTLSFRDYLTRANPQNISFTRNPWFTEYWEDLFKCDLPFSITNRYLHECKVDQRFSQPALQEFMGDQRVLHTIYVIQALFEGLKAAKEKFCKFDETFPCDAYRGEKHADIYLSILRNVKLLRNGMATRVFRDDGNGNIGFLINNVQIGTDGKLFYAQVGTFNDGILNLRKDLLKFYGKSMDGACTGSLCNHCNVDENIANTTMAVMTKSAGDFSADAFGVAQYTIIGILAFIIVLVILLCVCAICFFRKKLTDLHHQATEMKYEIRTGYSRQTGSAISAGHTIINYKGVDFHNTANASGGTLYEFNKANTALAASSRATVANGGVVNNGFVGSDMYIHARGSDDVDTSALSGNSKSNSSHHTHTSSERNSSIEMAQSSEYKPPSSHYGRLKANSSFKKPVDAQFKKQPRTQLAVPPCRPELPPRESDQPKLSPVRKPDLGAESADNDYSSQTNDTTSNERINATRHFTVSPTLGQVKYRSPPPYNKYTHNSESPYKDSGTNYPVSLKDSAYGTGTNQVFRDAYVLDLNGYPSQDSGGSMEKISRV